VAWCRKIIARKGITFAEQDALIDEVMRNFRVARLCADMTGMGEKPVEDWQRRYGEYLVEGVLFTGPSKLHLATVGKQGFEDKKERIPLGDRDVRADLHSLKKIVTPAGNARFDAERSEGGHADRAWAKFLASYARSTPYQPYSYEAVRPGSRIGRNGDDLEDDFRDVKATTGFRSRDGAM